MYAFQDLRRLKRTYSEARIDSTQSEDSDMSAEEGKSDSEISDGKIDQMRLDDDIPSTMYGILRTSQAKRKILKRSESEESISNLKDGGDGERDLKRRCSTSVHCSGNDILQQLNFRMDQLHDDVEKCYRRVSKEIKGIKNSILYDLNKKIEAIKSTIAVNLASVPREELKNYRENLGIQLPITTYEAFIEFDAMVKTNNYKSTALRAIMANYLGSATEVKEAVRKILGNLITKAVQELYSAVGRKGSNGVTKKNFSATHVYSCMIDVIKDRIEKADKKTILSAISRYLSGAGDREGGRANRDAKKLE